jgi:hypothetical protein
MIAVYGCRFDTAAGNRQNRSILAQDATFKKLAPGLRLR